MTITWTRPAHHDFRGIIAWITANNPATATRVGRRIPGAVEQLDQFPLLGRPGRSPGTRGLVIAGLPYLVVYSVDTVDPRSVAVLRVVHGAMLWLPA